MVAVGSKGVSHRKVGGGGLGVFVFFFLGGGMQESAGTITRTPEQHEQVTRGHAGDRATKGQRAEVTGEGKGQEQCRKDPG